MSQGDSRRPGVATDQGVESEGEDVSSIQRVAQEEKQALISDNDQQNV